ncbi:hypothetical protein JCM10512_2379 [Bacteroides reticulotermitis JCM 10512]|uniref:Outer membrane protein n=1 Tax=Bacteroides reticulotermitis JCM 10512 TaxID=1445607 RepID=W4UU99_9BACE|nr:hypothetical protein JCM10512_2379 [Bacteroides reticulotermitis JCM 10512]
MNKYINKLFMMSALAVAGMMGMTSCTDYLDKAPESDYQANDPYKNFKNFQGFTEELYNCIPAISNNKDAGHTCFNYGEDEYWEPQEMRLQARNVDNGDFWGWSTAYYAIRIIKERQVQQTELTKVIYGPTLGMLSVKPISVSQISAVW